MTKLKMNNDRRLQLQFEKRRNDAATKRAMESMKRKMPKRKAKTKAKEFIKKLCGSKTNAVNA